MSWDANQTSIRSRFEANTTIPSARLAHDGLNGPKFETPTVNPTSFDSAIWARLTIQSIPGSGRPLGVGSTTPHMREGFIVVQHFAPRGGGDNALKGYVDETMAIFDRESFGDVVCMDADEPDRVGFDESDEWYQINAVIPFYTLD